MAKPAAKPAAKAAPADAAAAPAKSNKLLIIIIAVLVLVIAGGAGWYFTQGHAPAAEHGEGAKAAPPAAHQAPQQPKYIPLGEKFTVNLQQEEGDRYLQVGITLKILDPGLEEALKGAMPEIRSKLLLLLSSKKPSELASTEGKQHLVQQVIAEVDAILGMGAAPAPAAQGKEHATPASDKTGGVVDVLFTDFIIQ